MLKKLFLLFLLFFHIGKVNISASENVPLKVEEVSSVFRVFLKMGFFIVFTAVTISIIKKIYVWFNPVNDDSYKSFERKLMVQNHQKFCGEIIEPIQKLINVLKTIPVTESCGSRFMSWVYSRSNENSINPELCKLLQKGYILYGPPGHGKNYVIQEMKNIFAKDPDPANQKIPFMCVNGDFSTKYAGGAAHNWKQTIDDLKKCIQKTPKKIGFLVIDECEKLFAKRTENSGSENLLGNILSTVDGFITDFSCKIVIIGLTNLIEYIDSGMISRCQTIYFIQSQDNLKGIIKEKLNSMKVDIPELTKFIDNGGLVLKQLKDKDFYYYDNTSVTPRDLDWVSSEIFTEWCNSQQNKKYQTQDNLVQAFNECSSDEKSSYFKKAFTIVLNNKPPLLYSNSLKLVFN